MPNIKVDEARCKGCELCTAACAKKCIVMSTTFSTTGYYPAVCCAPERCTGCGLCAQVCPDLAITVFKEEMAKK
ncbi:MAG: 4Fe-4S binding protein [Elusimicrobia bacterium]|nr:4Fe-4S binding protein [Elusimicrobiota bacterium]